MGTLTIRLPEDTHSRLRRLAESRHMSLNKLFEEMSVTALTEFDAEVRFRTRAARGDRQRALDLLDRLDTPRSRS